MGSHSQNLSGTFNFDHQETPGAGKTLGSYGDCMVYYRMNSKASSFHFSGLLWQKGSMGALKEERINIIILEALFIPSPALPFKSFEGTKSRKSHFCILALLQSPFTAQNLFHNVPFIKWKKFFKWETIKSELP